MKFEHHNCGEKIAYGRGQAQGMLAKTVNMPYAWATEIYKWLCRDYGYQQHSAERACFRLGMYSAMRGSHDAT